MSEITGFPPIARADARVLILGSMPGIASLQAVEYYAHPRNAFWPIMQHLLGVEGELSYAQRVEMAMQHKIAIWDSLQACEREGSLDASIRDRSARANDFEAFLNTHRQIQHIYFNGAKSEQVFKQKVLGSLSDEFDSITYTRLPSSSPAMASMTRAQKIGAWHAIIEALKI